MVCGSAESDHDHHKPARRRGDGHTPKGPQSPDPPFSNPWGSGDSLRFQESSCRETWLARAVGVRHPCSTPAWFGGLKQSACLPSSRSRKQTRRPGFLRLSLPLKCFFHRIKTSLSPALAMGCGWIGWTSWPVRDRETQRRSRLFCRSWAGPDPHCFAGAVALGAMTRTSKPS